MLQDLKQNLKIASMKIPVVVTADSNSSSVDLKDSLAAVIAVHLGDSGDTLSGTVLIDLELEHSDDDSAWSDCADADLTAAVTGTNLGTFARIDAPTEDSQVYSVGYLGNKRYVRCVVNVTGAHTNGFACGVSALLLPQKRPPL